MIDEILLILGMSGLKVVEHADNLAIFVSEMFPFGMKELVLVNSATPTKIETILFTNNTRQPSAVKWTKIATFVQCKLFGSDPGF